MRLIKKKIQPNQNQAPQIPAWQMQAMRGGLPQPNRHELFEAMQRDSMVQTALTVKRLGVLNSEWSIEPADSSAKAQETAQFIRDAFARMEGSVNTILYNSMDSFAHGWSVQEVMYAADGTQWWIQSVRPKNPKFFTVDLDEYENVTHLRLELPGDDARLLPVERFVIHRHRGGYGKPYGTSDLEAATPHFAAKRELVEAWKLHLARFASPTVMGRFSKETSSDAQSAMLSALDGLARNNAIVFPEEFEISTLGDSNNGASTGFMDAIDFHNREIARSILGQTLTTDEGRRVGSLAMGKVHLQVLLLQLEAIRTELADSVMTEQIIRPLIALNFGDAPIPKFTFAATKLSAFATGAI
jgi:phage gp29-like protein